jgi:hypothetical protein
MGSFLHFLLFEKAISGAGISRNLLCNSGDFREPVSGKMAFACPKAILTYTRKPTSFHQDLNATLH